MKLFADFSEGFDLIDHNILINKLEPLSVHPILQQWIATFLTNRSQCVQLINGIRSEWKTTNGGIPQGTRLGPILFNVMVNELAKKWGNRIKFVDDLTVTQITKEFTEFITYDC
jgi:retron-type reverse transcriptase